MVAVHVADENSFQFLETPSVFPKRKLDPFSRIYQIENVRECRQIVMWCLESGREPPLPFLETPHQMSWKIVINAESSAFALQHPGL